ncbi:calumenin-B-like [Pocillopora damicornis]|uniref:calumenin-B-like n=1 Tax=Pocillopora damicornis TaxID=46731 RepID=UPI000F555B2D|nr:calumenin-B-like [Pocillopora damicornis]
MLRGLSIVGFVSLCVCALSVSATKLFYPPLARVSDEDHYKKGEHNLEYDHEAFLGRALSSESSKLPVDEVMEKLSELFPKIDVDNDKKISIPELYGWIEQHMKKHVLRQADLKMQDMDSNNDGKISWEEYRETQYPSSTEKGLKEKGLGEFKILVSREKKRFDFADTDNDKVLSREELSFLLHPEESKRMTSYFVEESLDIFDTDKDGKISVDEYLGDEVNRLSKSKLDVLKKSFNKELDLNKDGFLDRNEIREWIFPGAHEDPILVEAKHLMKAGDDDKDTFLTEDELIKHYDIFAGSRVTSYGDLLKDEL